MSEQAGSAEFRAIGLPRKAGEFLVGDRVAVRKPFNVLCDAKGLLLLSVTGEVTEVPEEGRRYYRMTPDQAAHSTRDGIRGVYYPQESCLFLPVALELVHNRSQLPK